MTQTLTTERLREIAEDGFLEHGDAKALAAELLANREAQPVMYASKETLAYAKEGEKSLVTWSEPMGDAVIPLFTAPPAPAVVNGRTAEGWMAEALLQKKIADGLRKSAPAVPDAIEPTYEAIKAILPTANPDEYACCIGADMWNACRAAMLAVAPEGGK